MRLTSFLRMVACLLVAILLQSNFVTLAQQQTASNRSQIPAPPRTRVENVTETLHGTTIVDPYRWLENQDAPETRAWIEQQNRYTHSLLNAYPRRAQIRSRVEQLLRIDTISTPIVRGGRYFFMKRAANQNQSVIYFREGATGRDIPLIDANTMSRDGTTSVSINGVSDDGKLLLYAVQQGGRDENEVRIYDVDARRDTAERFPEARYFGGFAMTPDKTGIYYGRFSLPAGPRVFYHRMGTNPSEDREIFGQGYTPTNIIAPDVSWDGRYLTIYVFYGSSGKTEIFYKNLTDDSPIRPLVTGIDARFGGDIIGDRMFLYTDWEAPNGRIMEVDMRNPARANWRTLIPETESRLEGFSVIGGKLFVRYLENVVSRIKVFDYSGRNLQRDIRFPTLGTVSGVSGRPDSDEAFYSFSSFALPPTIYRYNARSGEQSVWARINIPVRSEDIETRQVFYTSRDGTRVPMFVVHRRGLRLDGNRPTLMTGYGGFNLSRTPGFSSQAAYWVEQGGVYVATNLRGGGEFGERWHRAGMLENKQNTFDDFIAAAEWLIQNRYTNPNRLAISGGSNGGLLVGAAMTQRPELFRAVICSVPLLDMVRYHNFLVARFWVPEYGSSDNPEQFRYIYRYSPYHNLREGVRYPAVMFVTGDADTRVAPLHARKMAARMQAIVASNPASADRPILLHYDTQAGHAGGTPVNKLIEDATDVLTFLMWQLGAES
jgi:prolyl oligopeptidase